MAARKRDDGLWKGVCGAHVLPSHAQVSPGTPPPPPAPPKSKAGPVASSTAIALPYRGEIPVGVQVKLRSARAEDEEVSPKSVAAQNARTPTIASRRNPRPPVAPFPAISFSWRAIEAPALESWASVVERC